MNSCKITEDLLPLYEENLVQPETKQWIEQHLASCPNCQKLTSATMEELPALPSPKKAASKMIKHAHLKLTIYQLLFVILSFAFAINTSLLNESFTFIFIVIQFSRYCWHSYPCLFGQFIQQLILSAPIRIGTLTKSFTTPLPFHFYGKLL